jgi:hypothetical protein
LAKNSASYEPNVVVPLRYHADGVAHAGIFYHHRLAYDTGEAIRSIVMACEVFASEKMRNRVEFL